LIMPQVVPAPSSRRHDDVRFIGALTGCYALSERHAEGEDGIPVFACRLCSISSSQAVLMAPVSAEEGETVAMHFSDFGILRARVARELSTGFVANLALDEAGRDKLASKIRWKRSNVQAHVPDKREFPRFMPRIPRTIMTMADGRLFPCFVIDISRSGAAVSAPILPGKGTPIAIGGLVGRVVRRLDVGFAMEFITVQDAEDLERKLVGPTSAVAALDEMAAASA
jgi:hypothetical protein